MMLKERKRKVRRRRGGTVPEERDGARERERYAAKLHPCKSQNVTTVLELALSPPLLFILLNLPLSSFPIRTFGGCEGGLDV